MAIGSRLGRAYVSIEADLEHFGKGLATKLRAELEPLLPEAKRVGKKIGEELVDGIISAIDRRIPTVRAHMAALLRSMQEGGKPLRIPLKLDGEGKLITEAEQAATRTTRKAGQAAQQAAGGFLGAVRSVFSALTRPIESFKGALSGAKGNGIAFAAAIYAVYWAALAAAGAFNAIGREVLNIIKLGLALPAVVAVIAAIAAPLMVSMIGINKAWDAMLKGDTKKFEESLKGLSRSAANFMRELNAAKPWFKGMAREVQESLFRPLVGVVPAAISEWGPSIKRGMSDVAAELGYTFRGIFEGLREPKTVDFLKSTFDTAGSIIRSLQDPLTHLAKSFRDLAMEGMPFLKKLGEKSGGWIEKFATWLDRKIADGSVKKWLDDAATTMRELGILLKDVGGLLATLFDESNQDGKSFIMEIDEMVRKFKDFAASPDGKLALEGIAAAANLAASAIKGQMYIVWGMVTALASLVGAVQRALEWLGILEKRKSGMAGAVGSAFGAAAAIAKRARGTITSGPEVALIGEAGREAVIPLSDPSRARELADKSGLTRMLASGGQQVTQIFYLGEEQVQARMVRTVNAVTGGAVRAAQYGGLAATGA